MKKNKLRYIMLLSSLIVLLLNSQAYCEDEYNKSLSQQYVDGNTNGNIVNDGYIVSQDSNCIYYSIYKKSTGYIYNIRKGKEKKFYSEKKAKISNLNLVGKYIYFTKNSKIYKIKLNDKNKKEVKVCNDMANYLTIHSDYMYYVNNSDGSKIYRINLKDNKKEKLSNDRTRYLNLIGDTIYYSNIDDKMKLYKVKIDGINREMVIDDNCFYINADKEWLYYGKEVAAKDPMKDPYYNLLYKVRLDGTEKTKIDITCDAEYINVEGNYIYYVNNFDGNKIYRIKTDGTERKKLNEDNCFDVNLSNGYIYYYRVMNDGSMNLCKMKCDGMDKQIVK